MLCVYAQNDGLHICKDHDPPDINIAVLQPATARYVTCLPEEPEWHVLSMNLLPKRFSNSSAALEHFRGVTEVSPDIGGLRKLNDNDKACCNLFLNAATLNANSTADIGNAVMDVKSHPAWKSGLGFMTGDVVSSDLMHVLAHIFDIRRFMRGSVKRALRMYFRLATASELERTLLQEYDDSPLKVQQMRLLTLVHSWLSTIQSFPRAIINQLPHAFLIRLMDQQRKSFEKSGVPSDRAKALGIYRATIKALDFIRLVWLHGLGIKQFDPFKFFSEESEAFAFVDYILRI